MIVIPVTIGEYFEDVDLASLVLYVGFSRAEGAFPNKRYGDRKVGESHEMSLRYFGTLSIRTWRIHLAGSFCEEM